MSAEIDLAAILVGGSLAAVVFLLVSMRRLKPFEVGVVTLFGAYRTTLSPGLTFVNPLARVTRVDLRTREVAVTGVEAPTGSGVRVRADLKLRFRVVDAARAVFKARDVEASTRSQLESSVRTRFEQLPLERVLAGDASTILGLLDAMNGACGGWGVRVESVDLKHVETVGSASGGPLS